MVSATILILTGRVIQNRDPLFPVAVSAVKRIPPESRVLFTLVVGGAIINYSPTSLVALDGRNDLIGKE